MTDPPHVLLRRATALLTDAGVPSPQYDAAELLAFVLGIERGLLPTIRELDEDRARRYTALVQRRAGREPLQYILGSAGFYGLEIRVGPGVFIPRPETELLVEHALREIAEIADPCVVDLCAGSGAIAIAIADQRPDARVVAVERSAEALPWLRANVARLAPQVRVVSDDVLRFSWTACGIDLVTCNPPYVPSASEVDPEVAEHDPSAAVFAGHDGLQLIRPLVARIAALLRPGGTLLLEHDASHQPQVLQLLRDTDAYLAVGGLPDLAARPRFAWARRG